MRRINALSLSYQSTCDVLIREQCHGRPPWTTERRYRLSPPDAVLSHGCRWKRRLRTV